MPNSEQGGWFSLTLQKANVGKPIDVVVVRLDETAQVHQVALTLTPKSWSGAGLLGCILK